MSCRTRTRADLWSRRVGDLEVKTQDQLRLATMADGELLESRVLAMPKLRSSVRCHAESADSMDSIGRTVDLGSTLRAWCGVATDTHAGR